MVGVGGRSKGCKTCRRRKIRCDETKPSCNNCERRRIPCEGYSRDIVFVNERSRLVPAESATLSALRASTRSLRTETPPEKTPRKSDSSTPPKNHVQTEDVQLAIGKQPPLSPFQEEICLSYMIRTLFGDGRNSPLGLHVWESAARTDSTRLGQTALQSLATTYFARMHGCDRSLLRQGDKLYVRAVEKLNREIVKPEAPLNHEIMLSCMVLYYYEVVMNTYDLGWVQHAGGVGALMERRGPERYMFQPDHGYFLFCRRMVIIHAVVTRRRSFLEREEWKTIPWNMNLKSKTVEHFVLDILAEMPGMMEDLDRVEKNGPAVTIHPLDSDGDKSLLESIKRRVVMAYKGLLNWRYEWEMTFINAVTETNMIPRSNLVANLDRPDCLATAFYYDNKKRAEEIQHYHLCLFWLLHLVVRLHDSSLIPAIFAEWPLAHRPVASNGLALPHENLEVMDVAREALRSVEYFAHPQHARRELLALLAPLRGCVVIFATREQVGLTRPHELSWARGVLRRIAEEFGFSFGNRLAQLPPFGYYLPGPNEDASPGTDSYTCIDPQTGYRQTFLPLSRRGVVS